MQSIHHLKEATIKTLRLNTRLKNTPYQFTLGFTTKIAKYWGDTSEATLTSTPGLRITPIFLSLSHFKRNVLLSFTDIDSGTKQVFSIRKGRQLIMWGEKKNSKRSPIIFALKLTLIFCYIRVSLCIIRCKGKLVIVWD